MQSGVSNASIVDLAGGEQSQRANSVMQHAWGDLNGQNRAARRTGVKPVGLLLLMGNQGWWESLPARLSRWLLAPPLRASADISCAHTLPCHYLRLTFPVPRQPWRLVSPFCLTGMVPAVLAEL